MYSALGVLALLSLVTIIRKNEQVGGIVFLLVSLMLLVIIGELTLSLEYGNFIYLSAALFSAFFIFSQLQFSRKWWARVLLFIIGFASLFLFASDLRFGEYLLSFDNTTAIVLLAFSMAAPYIMSTKLFVFERFFGGDSNLLRASLQLFIVGFLFFLGSFLFALPGVILVAVGFTTSAFLTGTTWRNLSTGLLLMPLLVATMDHTQLIEVDLSMGKVVLGVFFGAFLTLFTHAYSNSEKPLWWMLLLSSILTIGLTFLLVFLGTQKADLGGTDAFIGALMGLVLALMVLKENTGRDLVVVSMLLGGLLAIPLTLLENNMGDSNKSAKTEVKLSAFDSVANVELSDLNGKYTIDPSTFRLDFELGPKGGRTKGAFKEVNATIELSNDLENTKFSVVLPIKSLTTFNKFRDESLMSDEYFNAGKYSQLSFESLGIDEIEGGYALKGKFNMLGVVKEQVVQIKFLGIKDGKPVFVGRGGVDRRDFGMRSDPKEGNIVDFEFEISLIKK